MKNITDIIMESKLADLLKLAPEVEVVEEEPKSKNVLLKVFAVVGVVAVVLCGAYAAYRYFKPDYLEDYEDDFEDEEEEELEDEE